MLWSAADGYESAKSSYESACDPYFGYSKENKSACGSYGYERTSYDSAKSELESALSNVSMFCGTGDQLIKPMLRAFKKQAKNLNSEISHLKDKIKKLEAEKKALNNIVKPTQ